MERRASTASTSVARIAQPKPSRGTSVPSAVGTHASMCRPARVVSKITVSGASPSGDLAERRAGLVDREAQVLDGVEVVVHPDREVTGHGADGGQLGRRGGHPQFEPLGAASVLGEGSPRVDHPCVLLRSPRARVSGARPFVVSVPARVFQRERDRDPAVANRSALPRAIRARNVAVATPHRRRPRGCRYPVAGIGWPEMSTGPGSLPPLPGAAGDEGTAALVAAMEDAPAAIYCVTAAAEPVWANARARPSARSSGRHAGGRTGARLADLVDAVLRTGQPETVCGPLGAGGPSATVMVRPLRVGGGRGALVVLESDDAATDTSLWPKPADVVEQAQLSLLPPSLPMLPDLRLSGSYHRATSARAAGGDWYDAVSLGSGRVALVVGDAVGHGVPAAGAMSRLRGAMRSSALRDPSPAAVLAALDAFAGADGGRRGRLGLLRGAGRRHRRPHLRGGRATRRRWWSAPDGATTFLPLTPRPPLGSVPGSRDRRRRARARAGRDARALLQRRRGGRRRGADDALGRLAEVAQARDRRARRAGRRRTGRAGRGGRRGRALTGGMAGRRRRPRGAPPGGLRGTAAPGPGRHPLGAAGDPPPAGQLAHGAGHGGAGPRRGDGRRRRGLRQRGRARLPRQRARPHVRHRAGRRRRGAHRGRARRGRLAAAGPRPR